MMFLPALRFLMRPFPPFALVARFLAAVILPPLLFFMILAPWLRSPRLVTQGARSLWVKQHMAGPGFVNQQLAQALL